MQNGLSAGGRGCTASVKSTIVTIADFTWRPDQLLERLSALAASLVGSEFDLVIGHADRGRSPDAVLHRRMDVFDHVKIVRVAPVDSNQELARLRNAAVSAVNSEILLLLDVDIWPDLRLFKKLIEQVAVGERLAIAPCIYLSVEGNRKIRQDGGCAKVIDGALGFSVDDVMHWALPSSVMALRHSDFLAVGGFYEAYLGHGYEDFDFMIRLALHAGKIKPSSDLLIDQTYRAPLLANGFRAALGMLCIPNLLDKNIAFHLYHEKDRQSVYQRRRLANAAIFQSRMRELLSLNVRPGGSGNTPELITSFFFECARRCIDPSTFHALFDPRPRHLLRRSSWWSFAQRVLN